MDAPEENEPEKDLTTRERHIRTAAESGAAIRAWRLAYSLAWLPAPKPNQDAPIWFSRSEMPALVTVALRWISDEAARQPASEADEVDRLRGDISYFVHHEVALALIDKAGSHKDRWRAMPRVRVLDAAALICGDAPAPGITHVEQLTQEQHEAVGTIVRETGHRAPAELDPIYDGSDWITAAQLRRLLKAYGPEPVDTYLPFRYQSRPAIVLEAIRRLGWDNRALPPNRPGLAGARKRVMEAALDTHAAAFGNNDKSRKSAFAHVWEQMFKDGDLAYCNDPS